MRLGLSCYSCRFAGELGEFAPAHERLVSARELLSQARVLGLEGVQLLGREQADSRDFSGLVALRQEAEEGGLFLELAGSGVQPEAVKTMVRTASVIGSPLLSLRLGLGRAANRAELESGLRLAAANLRQVLPTCEKYGVALAIENDMDYTSAELLQLLGKLDSEWVGISFDTGNQLAVIEPPAAALAALAPYLYNVHLSDWQLSAYPEGLVLHGCALGDGVIDLADLLKVIQAHSPQVSLHLCSRLEERELPVLSPAFLDRFFDRRPHDLAALLRLYWERGLRQTPPQQREEGASERQERMLSRSAHFLLQLKQGLLSQEPRCSKPS